MTNTNKYANTNTNFAELQAGYESRSFDHFPAEAENLVIEICVLTTIQWFGV